MKPGGQTEPKGPAKLPGPLRGPLERFLSGSAPTDPLYLTNRSLPQKIKSWSLILVPGLFLVAGVAYLLRTLNPPEAKPVHEPTTAEIAAKMSNLAKDIKLAPALEVQVLEIHADSTHVFGTVQNTSKREIGGVRLVIELTTETGSRVGAVDWTLEKIPASARKEFQFPIRQRNAAVALVREITTF